jgi:hypothetical protein
MPLPSSTRSKEMPLHMPNCKTCGEVFPGIYVAEAEESSYDFKSAATDAQRLHMCSRDAQKGVCYIRL